MCKHGSEVSWIYAGIITSSLFRVDIPSSSKSIGFGTKASRTETDDEVELAEEFGPLDLAAGEQFSGRKILKIFMICHHVNQGQRSLKVMMPYFECFENGEQFFVMDIVVELRWGKSLRVKGNWMDFTIGWKYGGKDGSEGIVQGIYFNDKWRAWNTVGQDWHSGEGFLQGHEGGVALIGEVPSCSFTSETSERNSDFGVFQNKTLIEIGKAQEGLDVFNLSGFGPILNDLDFVGHGVSVLSWSQSR